MTWFVAVAEKCVIDGKPARSATAATCLDRVITAENEAEAQVIADSFPPEMIPRPYELNGPVVPEYGQPMPYAEWVRHMRIEPA